MRRHSSKKAPKKLSMQKQKKSSYENKGGKKTSPLSRRDPEVEALDRLNMAVMKALQNNIRQASAANPQLRVLEKQIEESLDQIIPTFLEDNVMEALKKIEKVASKFTDPRFATLNSRISARETLKHSTYLRAELKSGNPKKAAWHALWVGMMYARLRFGFFEKIIETGTRTRAGLEYGRKRRHGTTEEKLKRWASYQKEGNRLKREKPHLSKNRIHQLVAKKFGVSLKTVQRRTQLPS